MKDGWMEGGSERVTGARRGGANTQTDGWNVWTYVFGRLVGSSFWTHLVLLSAPAVLMDAWMDG